MNIRDPIERRCVNCGVQKSITEFYACKPRGFVIRCKKCVCEAAKAKRREKRSPPRPAADRIMEVTIPVPEAGCWIFTGVPQRRGYGRISFSGKTIVLSRLSYETFVGQIPEGMMVLHKCDTPQCANPDHLFLGNARDNVYDMLAKGRSRSTGLRGSESPSSKLTDDQVKHIRESGLPQRRLAKQHGVCKATIYYVQKRLSWRSAA